MVRGLKLGALGAFAVSFHAVSCAGVVGVKACHDLRLSAETFMVAQSEQQRGKGCRAGDHEGTMRRE